MSSSFKNKVNFYQEFKECYFKILKDFKFNYDRDKQARDYLQKLILKKPKEWSSDKVFKSIEEIIKSKEVIFVYGCGPSLEATINYVIQCKGTQIFNNFSNLSADGSSRLLRKNHIPLDAVFTDLDGITEEEFYYSKFVIIHAHGDNMDKLREFKQDIIRFENIIGTTQVKPIKEIINHGGFTDGDRILFFLRPIVNSDYKIYLIGMDFDEIVGKYSKIGHAENFKASKIKRKKLKYAEKLIDWITSKIKCDIYYVNSNTKSKKIKNLRLEEFKQEVLDKY